MNCFGVKDLAINGRDLIKMGFKEGKEVGKTLNILLDKVMENPMLNKKELLCEMASELLEKFEKHGSI